MHLPPGLFIYNPEADSIWMIVGIRQQQVVKPSDLDKNTGGYIMLEPGERLVNRAEAEAILAARGI
jgi:hypothetical protein